jgi:hypothetical protein
MKVNDLLPIGSVVRLKGAKRLVMIFGVMQSSASRPDLRHDYIAVSYPEGHMDPRLHLGFQHEDIEEVVFRGYEDDKNDRKAFLAALHMAVELKGKKKAEDGERG